jgi:hypothetical protein
LDAAKKQEAEEAGKKMNEALAKVLQHEPKHPLQIYIEFNQIIPGKPGPEDTLDSDSPGF